MPPRMIGHGGTAESVGAGLRMDRDRRSVRGRPIALHSRSHRKFAFSGKQVGSIPEAHLSHLRVNAGGLIRRQQALLD